MRTLSRPVALSLFLLGACKDGDSDDSDTNVDPSDIDGDPATAVADYTSQFGISGDDPACEELVTDDCRYDDLEGATAFFVAEYVIDGDQVNGYEALVLYPNAPWAATDGAVDCQMVWVISGQKVEATGFGDYGLEVHGVLQAGSSECPSGRVQDAENAGPFDQTYNVDDNNGEITVYYAASGDIVGTGTGDNGAIQYATVGTCEWYGSGECDPL